MLAGPRAWLLLGIEIAIGIGIDPFSLKLGHPLCLAAPPPVLAVR